MNATPLTHDDCVRLVRSPERYRTGLISVDGHAPLVLACLVLDEGDLLIPTASDRTLQRTSRGCPVIANFTHHGLCTSWSITGSGLARPLREHDRPSPMPHTPLSLAGFFENGIRVLMARFTGRRGGDVHVPRQRTIAGRRSAAETVATAR
ncbi:hypothetical protein [Amycolatopsis minnesotensis]|uniref:Pyridoxamine 5'-phosphate oxidase n=1 Tax=Amycolatopsis minnesotensis TaxID=337894 RepID=A0ABP5BBC5_9PSEU